VGAFPKPPEGIRDVGFAAAEFTFAQPNGVTVRAPLEFFVAAMLYELPTPVLERVLANVERIKANQIEITGTDGFPVRVSRVG